MTYSDKRVLCSTSPSCLAIVCKKRQNLRKVIEFKGIKTLVDSKDLLLIIEDKINFNLGFDNREYQTNKLSNPHKLHCPIVLYIVQ